ncbi:hypothetical protein [Paraburkholderia diazotrophica]|uniref:hypothetical protein n=1 Tax=Paraburkholderia diazotrophica TaxID=667676 RepID=UPI0015A59253|nr:hypothetical protein [Paraburkholderia diazotrophica]
MNEPGLVTISMKELQRIKVIEAVVKGRLSGVRARPGRPRARCWCSSMTRPGG